MIAEYVRIAVNEISTRSNCLSFFHVLSSLVLTLSEMV